MQEAPAITKAALEGSDPLAVEAVDIFLAIVGSEAGGNSLRVLAQGGVYLCGGILPRVRDLGFAAEFEIHGGCSKVDSRAMPGHPRWRTGHGITG